MNLKRVKQLTGILAVVCALMAAVTMATGSTVAGVLMVVPMIALVTVHLLYWRCPHCKQRLSRNLEHFCPHCGKNLPDWTEL